MKFPWLSNYLRLHGDAAWIRNALDHSPAPMPGSRLELTWKITHPDGTIEETVFHDVRVTTPLDDVMAADIEPEEPESIGVPVSMPVREGPPRFRLLILARLIANEGGETHRTTVTTPTGEST